MITSLIRRVLPLAGVGVVFAAATRNAELPQAGGDMWFHLRLGDEFRSGWSIDRPGHLGAFDSADWLPTQWLAQVGMSAMESAGGLAGLLLLASTLHIVLIALIYVSARSFAAPLASALTAAVAVMGLAAGLTARPQVLSYIFTALTVWAWGKTAEDGRPRYWLIALSWLWVSLHGMWPVGVAISAVMAVAVALERREGRAAQVRLAVVPVGSAVVVLASPLGWHAYSGVAAVGARSRYFAEWGPPDFTDARTAGVTLMLAVVLLWLSRSGRMPWPIIALLGLGVACALLSFRMVPVAAVILAPLFARAVQAVLPPADRVGRAETSALVGMAAIVLSVMAPVLASRADQDVVPAWVDERLESVPAGSRVLNEWNSGAYFLWRHPDLDFAMHGYGDVFTQAELERNADISRLQPGWDVLVTDLEADLALVDTGTALSYALTEHAGWRVVEEDAEFRLLEPPPPPSSNDAP